MTRRDPKKLDTQLPDPIDQSAVHGPYVDGGTAKADDRGPEEVEEDTVVERGRGDRDDDKQSEVNKDVGASEGEKDKPDAGTKDDSRSADGRIHVEQVSVSCDKCSRWMVLGQIPPDLDAFRCPSCGRVLICQMFNGEPTVSSS